MNMHFCKFQHKTTKHFFLKKVGGIAFHDVHGATFHNVNGMALHHLWVIGICACKHMCEIVKNMEKMIPCTPFSHACESPPQICFSKWAKISHTYRWKQEVVNLKLIKI
jgi:hypothetical protein